MNQETENPNYFLCFSITKHHAYNLNVLKRAFISTKNVDKIRLDNDFNTLQDWLDKASNLYWIKHDNVSLDLLGCGICFYCCV